MVVVHVVVHVGKEFADPQINLLVYLLTGFGINVGRGIVNYVAFDGL